MKLAHNFYRCAYKLDKRTTFYAAQVPGESGKDWGFVTNPVQARPMSQYWTKRFVRYGAYCGWRSVTAIPFS